MASPAKSTPPTTPQKSQQDLKSPPSTPRKIPKLSSLANTHGHVLSLMDNIDTALSAALFKMSLHNYNDVERHLRSAVDQICCSKAKLAADLSAAQDEYNHMSRRVMSLSQRIIGMERTQAYLREQLAKLKMTTSTSDDFDDTDADLALVSEEAIIVAKPAASTFAEETHDSRPSCSVSEGPDPSAAPSTSSEN